VTGKRVLFLFPSFGKYVGVLLMCIGAVGLYLSIYLGIKPSFLQLNVFTFHSKFIESSFFSFIKNNQFDELSNTLYFIGAIMFFLSSEKKANDFFYANKLKALSFSLLFSIILYAFFYVFFHGMSIIVIALVFFYLIPVFYIVLYSLFNIVSGK
jgi:hypothetical protein